MKLKSGYMQKVTEIESTQRRLALQNKHVLWKDLFKDEEDIIKTLKAIDTNKLNVLVEYRLIKGYDYIISFTSQLHRDKILSEKQITQCKRLANEIHKAEVLMDYVE